MEIPVEISVGCKIVYYDDAVGLADGTVTRVRGDFINIEGNIVVDIKKIIQFTFGGVWMKNHKQDLNIIHFIP